MSAPVPAPVLAIDTALARCAVAVVGGGAEHVLAEPMTKGHAERLPLMAREALEGAGVSAGELERVVVAVGPGSFTGVRVGLAFARGLCIGTKAVAVGVTSLEALAGSAGAASAGEAVAALIDARREETFLQVFDGADGAPLGAPEIASVAAAAGRLVSLAGGRPLRLVGSGADLVLPGLVASGIAARRDGPDAIDPLALARIGAARAASPEGPRALYIRAPDATPPAPSPFAPQ